MTLTEFFLLWFLTVGAACWWLWAVLRPRIVDEVHEKIRADYPRIEINSITRAVSYATDMLAVDPELLQRRKLTAQEHSWTLDGITAAISDPKHCVKF